MDKNEILEKSQKSKDIVGEMERNKINKSSWISLIVTAVVAIAFIIAEGALGHFSAVYAIASICFIWAAVFYTLQFFLAKRPWQVLIGSVLEAMAGIFFIVRYILAVSGVWV